MALAEAIIGEVKKITYSLVYKTGVPVNISEDLDSIKINIYLDGVQRSDRFAYPHIDDWQDITIVPDTTNQIEISVDLASYIAGLCLTTLGLYFKPEKGEAPEIESIPVFQIKKGNV